jgi:tetratricopeptide (TPR) repeat protein
MSRDGEAAMLYRRALELFSTVLGTEHPEVATTLLSMAKFYEERKKFDKASTLTNLAVQIYEKNYGPDHKAVGSAVKDLAEIYAAQGRTIEAEDLRKRARAILGG